MSISEVKRCKTVYQKVPSYQTKDGSIIRELMHPKVHTNRNQSLAEATIPAGFETTPHHHSHSEEIYHVVEGHGVMTLSGEQFEIHRGDTICILPGQQHCVINTGRHPMKILCCCAPPYSHEDTHLDCSGEPRDGQTDST
jgi:mannose-6-phosphate isomerase-like protein (cupin superfamily)